MINNWDDLEAACEEMGINWVSLLLHYPTFGDEADAQT